MKKSNYKYIFLLLLFLYGNIIYGQVTIPSNCAKEAVLLYTIPDCNKNAYELVLEDNFDGNKLDTSIWELPCCYFSALEGGQHIEYNTLNNVSISEGTCKITSKKETVVRRLTTWYDSTEILSDGLINLRTFEYTSGTIWTKKEFFHGKYEARCRMPHGKGLWPAFWLYGGKRWNEIDVFDSYKGINTYVTSIRHDYEGHGKATGCEETFGGYDLSEWHTFTCFFDFDKISFLVDGRLVRVIHRMVTVSGQPINCDDNIAVGTYNFLKSYPVEKMHLILNLAILSKTGPAGSIAADENTPTIATFEIDYVKIWKKGQELITVSAQPNPTAGNFTITSNQNIISIQISNSDGTKIHAEEVGGMNKEINFSKLSVGMYFVSAFFEDGFRTIKIIKTED